MATTSLELVGLNELADLLEASGVRAPQLLEAALWNEANHMLGVSVEQFVPVRDGILRGSAVVVTPKRTVGRGGGGRFVSGGKVEVRFGYGGAASAYALAVHENPRAGRTGGTSPSGRKYKKWAQVGQWKFLEQPVLQEWPSAPGRMTATVGRVFEEE